jgi:hypothetical protein
VAAAVAAAASASQPPASASQPASASSESESASASEPAADSVVQDVPAGDPLPVWERIIGHIREARPALAAVLEHGIPLSIEREKLVLGFPEGSFFGKQAESRESKEGIAEGASKVIGKSPEIVIRFTEEAEKAGLSVAEASARQRTDLREERKREALAHPRVQEALQIFPEGAGNVKVRVDLD